MLKTYISFFVALCCVSYVFAQDSITVEGYTYETDNRGYLKDVRVRAFSGDTLYGESAPTDRDGKFTLRLPVKPQQYRLRAVRTAFHDKEILIEWALPPANPVVYTKMEMERLPGYMLEVSVTDFVQEGDTNAVTYGINGATIEVYNNTMQREVLRLVNHPQPGFSVFLEQGNEYIFMLRKEGYFTKRLRANINVNGCILCMEGFGTVTPGVVENLSQNNTKGVLLTMVGLKKMILNETVQMPNIYYDSGKSTLRPEALPQLDKLAEMLKDNPQVSIELSSHTDCRGSNKTNLELSQHRAESVVHYIVHRSRINRNRIKAKGYGETRPVNTCIDGVECSDEAHQQNRRTEFTLIDIQKENDPYRERTLADIMQEENMERQLAAIQETYTEEVSPVVRTNAKTVKPPQAIPFQYTGFKVELMRQNGNPDLNDPIFQAFEMVFLDVDAAGSVVFLMGDFSSKAAAEQELNRLRRQYPKAVVAEYQQGVRK